MDFHIIVLIIFTAKEDANTESPTNIILLMNRHIKTNECLFYKTNIVVVHADNASNNIGFVCTNIALRV